MTQLLWPSRPFDAADRAAGRRDARWQVRKALGSRVRVAYVFTWPNGEVRVYIAGGRSYSGFLVRELVVWGDVGECLDYYVWAHICFTLPCSYCGRSR